MPKEQCPTCGTHCEVHTGREGTGCFIPADAEIERLTKELEAIHAIAISSGDADTTEHEDDTLTLRYVKRMAYTIQNGSDLW